MRNYIGYQVDFLLVLEFNNSWWMRFFVFDEDVDNDPSEIKKYENASQIDTELQTKTKAALILQHSFEQWVLN